jgi:hypothetical protein
MHLQLDDNDLNYVVAILRKRPWDEVNLLLYKIGQQMNQQQQNRDERLPEKRGNNHDVSPEPVSG